MTSGARHSFKPVPADQFKDPASLPSRGGRYSGLTDERWAEIEQMLAMEREHSRKCLAERYGISQSTLDHWFKQVREGRRPKRARD